MNNQLSDKAVLAKWLVIFDDLLWVNVAYYIATYIGLIVHDSLTLLLWNVAYILSIFFFVPVAHNRLAKYEQVIGRAFLAAVMMTAVFLVTLKFVNSIHLTLSSLAINLGLLFGTFIVSRTISRLFLQFFRSKGKDNQRVVFVGAGVNLSALYDRLTSNFNYGYKVLGYFEEKPSQHLPKNLVQLGRVEDTIGYMENHHVDNLFCNLPSSRAAEIKEIMDYCENHLIRFYSVPNVRNYVHRAMNVEFVDDIPVLSVRYEPLREPLNRFIKRAFDLLVSGLFLITCFWWIYLIVALITKITMPGPVFFKQKRNGLYGKEFGCLKFRSMKVNDDADKVQATKDDPRKTKWGNIMRKTNIDELPQFLNVFMGDMSVVGPRPHMVLHTEQYSELVDKYMVRHWAKPGITGWAQTNGARGETKELWEMEDRIEKDIWYVENWSFWLDIRIMFLTVYNVFGGEKGNAY